jgi:predicted transcriptional regulator
MSAHTVSLRAQHPVQITPQQGGLHRRATLQAAADGVLAPPTAAKHTPAHERQVPIPPDAEAIARSVQDDHLVSFGDGTSYRSLKRHLMAKYGMTPEEYRRKWNLPADYPMVAPSYARERSEVAKRIGLGRGATSESAPKLSRNR